MYITEMAQKWHQSTVWNVTPHTAMLTISLYVDVRALLQYLHAWL